MQVAIEGKPQTSTWNSSVW